LIVLYRVNRLAAPMTPLKVFEEIDEAAAG
jgi:hypothetical protein